MKFLPLILLLSIAPLCGRGQEEYAPTPTPQAEMISVNVLGAVNHPSRFSMAKGSTVLDALAQAGDFNQFAAAAKVKLIRKGTGPKPDVTVINVKAMLDGSEKAPALRDGDTLYVPASPY